MDTHPLAAAKIDAAIDEYLNGRDPSGPPPEFPATSQIEGELRELRVRFAKTRYRVLYQRSGNLMVLLHAFEKNTGAVPTSDQRKPKRGWPTSGRGWTRSAVSGPGPPGAMPLRVHANSGMAYQP